MFRAGDSKDGNGTSQKLFVSIESARIGLAIVFAYQFTLFALCVCSSTTTTTARDARVCECLRTMNCQYAEWFRLWLTHTHANRFMFVHAHTRRRRQCVRLDACDGRSRLCWRPRRVCGVCVPREVSPRRGRTTVNAHIHRPTDLSHTCPEMHAHLRAKAARLFQRRNAIVPMDFPSAGKCCLWIA